jgi:hypothetical protein
MSYAVAWIVAILAGLGGSISLVYLTRPMENRWLRNLLCCLPGVLMLTPAPVPGYAGHFAPAFIVFAFEALFQRDGQSLGAATILLTAGVLAALTVVLATRYGDQKSVRETDDN